LCVERAPIILRPLNDIEQRYSALCAQIEVENSLLSDHEIWTKEFQCVLDTGMCADCRFPVCSVSKSKATKSQIGKNVATNEKTEGDKMLTPQDVLDMAAAQMRQFQTKIAPIVTGTSVCECTLVPESAVCTEADTSNNTRSLERALAERLLLVVQQDYNRTDGYRSPWQLPHARVVGNDSLRQVIQTVCPVCAKRADG
jgi:hypothetical protein